MFEKRYGDRGGIEDVIVSKRKFQYEEVCQFSDVYFFNSFVFFFDRAVCDKLDTLFSELLKISFVVNFVIWRATFSQNLRFLLRLKIVF